jgi:hypothetical protein
MEKYRYPQGYVNPDLHKLDLHTFSHQVIYIGSVDLLLYPELVLRFITITVC